MSHPHGAFLRVDETTAPSRRGPVVSCVTLSPCFRLDFNHAALMMERSRPRVGPVVMVAVVASDLVVFDLTLESFWLCAFSFFHIGCHQGAREMHTTPALLSLFPRELSCRWLLLHISTPPPPCNVDISQLFLTANYQNRLLRWGELLCSSIFSRITRLFVVIVSSGSIKTFKKTETQMFLTAAIM